MKLKNHTKKKRTTKPKTRHSKYKTRHAKTLRLKMRKTMGGRDHQYRIDIVKHKGPTGENMIYVDVINDPIVIDGFLDLGNIGKVVSKYSGDVENELIITQKGISDPSHDRKVINVHIPDENSLKFNRTIKKKSTTPPPLPIIPVIVNELPKQNPMEKEKPILPKKPVELKAEKKVKQVERLQTEKPMTLRPRSTRTAAKPGQIKGAFSDYDDTLSETSDSTYVPSTISSPLPKRRRG